MTLSRKRLKLSAHACADDSEQAERTELVISVPFSAVLNLTPGEWCGESERAKAVLAENLLEWLYAAGSRTGQEKGDDETLKRGLIEALDFEQVEVIDTGRL